MTATLNNVVRQKPDTDGDFIGLERTPTAL